MRTRVARQTVPTSRADGALPGARRRRAPGAADVLLACVVLVTLVAAPAALAGVPRGLAGPPGASWPWATTAHRAQTEVVLAQDDGLMLVGRTGALRGRPAPQLESLTETQADDLASLPADNVFFRGADCSWTARASRFASPVTLTFTLPKAVFSRTALPLYRFDGHAWRRLGRRAVVGEVDTTASATITQPGRYALLLTKTWKVESEDGYTLVVYTGHVPSTDLRDPVVTASGATDDPAVIAAVAQATGTTEQKAVSTLRSFDSSTGTPVQVITLTHATVLVRNWSGTSTVGRWFAPSEDGPLPSPDTARRIYALPADNTAVNATLHLVKRQVVLITGVCSDMTDQSGYGPWATGGGEQLFGPDVSTYPPPAYDPVQTVILCDLRWEKSAVDDIVW